MHNQIQRDEAVARNEKLERLFISMLAQLRALELPVTPLIINDGPPLNKRQIEELRRCWIEQHPFIKGVNQCQ